MKRIVDDSGRAILPIWIFCGKHPLGVEVDTWIDTRFTGDFVFPELSIQKDPKFVPSINTATVATKGNRIVMAAMSLYP